MAENQSTNGASAALVLADGRAWLGQGWGHVGTAVGELCFNTAMTGYQEILTDPSYARQVMLFTFPHIGNVGTNSDDEEAANPRAEKAAVGTVFRMPVTPASNHRSLGGFDAWLAARGMVGLSGVDTRALTRIIREEGMQKVAIAHNPAGVFDVDALAAEAAAWDGLEGADLALDVATATPIETASGLWTQSAGFAAPQTPHHVVMLDFGTKQNILRNLASAGIRATVLPGDATLDQIMAHAPDGVVLSNGPGDPAATFARAGEGRRRIARPIGEHNAVRRVGHDLVQRCIAGKHGRADASAGEVAQDVLLGPEIEHDDMVRRLRCSEPSRLCPQTGSGFDRRGRCDIKGEVCALKPVPGRRLCRQRVHVEHAGGIVRDSHLLHALLADDARQGAGVDA